MSHQSAIIAMLTILSIAALGVFTVQVANAQIPRLFVGDSEVAVQTEGSLFAASERGARVQTEEFIFDAGPRGVIISPPDP